jgi:predicted enzyme related to lactoylglutathione lyase
MGDDMTYYLFGGASDPCAGMMATPPNAPPSWFLYFTVGDIDVKVVAVSELGGQVIHRMDIPTVGRMAVCAAPDGSHFGIAQWEMPPEG